MTAMTSLHLNWVDLSIFCIILLSIVIGCFRGFISEVISLIVWGIGIITALRFAAPLSTHWLSKLHSPTLGWVIAFCFILFVILALGLLLNRLVGALVKHSGFRMADCVLGFIFGALRGILLITLCLIFAQMGALSYNDLFQNTWSVQKFSPLVHWLKNFMPKQMPWVSAWIDSDNPSKKDQRKPSYGA